MRPKTSKEERLLYVLVGIREGTWRVAVETLRNIEPTTSEYGNTKKTLPGFTASGTFSGRSKAGLREHSGFMCLDIDAKENTGIDLIAVRKAVEMDPYTYACFTSVGGRGWASIIRIPVTGIDHEGSFRALEEYYLDTYGLTVDGACKDVSRLRFVSYDSSLYLNEQAATFEKRLSELKVIRIPAAKQSIRPVPPRGEGYGQRALEQACEKVRAAPDGSKHTQLNKMAYLCGGYVGSGVLTEADAQFSLEAAISTRDVKDLPAAFKTIKEGLRQGQSNPILPEPLQRIVRQKQREENSSESIIKALNAITGASGDKLLGGVDAVLEESNPTILTFWKVLCKEGKRASQDSYKLQVERYELREWLRQQGFSFRPAGAGGSVDFLHTRDNIVRLVERYELKQHVLNYVEQLPPRFDNVERADLLEAVMSQIRMLFDKEALDCLPPMVGHFLNDTSSVARFFFRNCWVEVTASAMNLRPYNELPGLIWHSQVRPHDFKAIYHLEAKSCHFHTFLIKVTNQEPKRLTQLQSALGYLLHGYKDDSQARAVIFVDQVGTAGQPAGGTGKSLLMRAVGEVVKVTQLPGATFRFDDDFRFALVGDDTRVVYFDEWDGRRLPFKKLFTEITSDLVVNRKNKPQIVVAFANSPKFAITTNDMVTGHGSSHARRKLEIALSAHYSEAYTPKDEFGTGFFNQGWDEHDYLYFFNLAMGWVQQYLAEGLIMLKDEHIDARKLEQETSPEFVDFAQAVLNQNADSQDEPLWANDLYQQYIDENGDSKSRFTSRQFIKWMQLFGFKKERNTKRGERRMQYYFCRPTGKKVVQENKNELTNHFNN